MKKTLYKTYNTKIVGLFFTIFSIVFIIVGIIVLMIPKIKSNKCTESVRAEVVENIMVSSHHSSGNRHHGTSTMFKPVFEFTYNGEEYSVVSQNSSNPPAFQEGEIVELKINPDDPTDFYAPADNTTKFIGIIFTGMGALFMILGIVMIAVFGKNNKNPEDEEVL